jgi:hypothetical protein
MGDRTVPMPLAEQDNTNTEEMQLYIDSPNWVRIPDFNILPV